MEHRVVVARRQRAVTRHLCLLTTCNKEDANMNKRHDGELSNSLYMYLLITAYYMLHNRVLDDTQQCA